MSTLSFAARDSATMLRRNLRHTLRYPSMTLMLAGMPVVFLLIFVYVFGGTLGDGLGGVSGGRAEYVNYVTPGIILMTIAGAATGTAVSIAMDMTEGIVARFRTMAISRASVPTGHVVGSVIQTLLSMAIVVGAALLIGFRPTAGPMEWVEATGILALLVLALTSEYQPFTPVIDTLRGPLLGDPIGDSAVVATAWCAGITLVCYLWAKKLFNRDPSR
jgi:ABC-2 type transport system permease protein